MRRLPLYMMIDTSGSMAGEAMHAAQQALRLVIGDLQHDTGKQAPVWVSVLAYGDAALQLLPLTPLDDFHPPQLGAPAGLSSLGAGFSLLRHVIGIERQSEDLAPVLLLMGDGEASDEWHRPGRQLRAAHPLHAIGLTVEMASVFSPYALFCNRVESVRQLTPGHLSAMLPWKSREQVAAGGSPLRDPDEVGPIRQQPDEQMSSLIP